MPSYQTQISFSAFASAALASATATQPPAQQARKQASAAQTPTSFQQPSLTLRAVDGSFVCTPPVLAVHPAAPVVAHGVDGGGCSRPFKKSWVVFVQFVAGARAGEVHSFRWFSLREARRCARDFSTAAVSLVECVGRSTFSGWVDAWPAPRTLT